MLDFEYKWSFILGLTWLSRSISSLRFTRLSGFTVSPCHRWAPGDVRTWRTCRCPSRSPSRRGLRQRWRHSARLWRRNDHGKPSAFTFDHFHSLTKLGEMPQQGRRCGCEPVLGTVQLQLSDHKNQTVGRLIAFSAAEGLIKHFICLRPRRCLSHATEHFFNFLTGYLLAGLEGRAGGGG